MALRLCLQKDLRRPRAGDWRHQARFGPRVRIHSSGERYRTGRRMVRIAPASPRAAGLALIAGTGAAVWLATQPDPPGVAEVLLAPQTGPAALSITARRRVDDDDG